MTALANINPDSIVWQPVPNSSQELAVATISDHTLFCGTRGGGKTATQLMWFRKFVGRGYGAFLRGVIFDREFKHLSDLVAQSKRFFKDFDDGCKFLESGSDYKWVWATGEELLFRHVKKLSDYDSYHGHEYCLHKNELLPLMHGNIAIKDCVVGDMIYTPAGYKRINHVFSVGAKKGVKVSTYTLDGRLRSVQHQSVDHRLLTSELEWRKSSSHLYQNVKLSDEMNGFALTNHKFQNDERQENLEIFYQSEYAEIFAKGIDTIRQSVYQCLSSQPFSVIQLRRLLLSLVIYGKQTPISRYELLEFFGLTLSSMVNLIKQCSGYWLRLTLEQQLLALKKYPRRDVVLNDRVVSCRVQDFQERCSDDHGQCDELAQSDIENALLIAQLLLDAQDSVLGELLGASVDVETRNRQHQLFFQHPYQADRLIGTEHQLLDAVVVVEPCDELDCYDLEVDDVNCYYTTSGVINKNCMIGWNELTKYPTADLYDKMMSTNRSSFVPEKHTPKIKCNPKTPNAIKNKHTGVWEVYNTPDGLPLPPIPLQVFSTCNPSGAGNNWVKRRFITPAPYGKQVIRETEVYDPKTRKDVIVRKTQMAIFSTYRENIYLDPKYIAELDRLTENDENLRKAWLEGSWDITAGGAIDDLWNRNIHIIPRFPIPESWHIDRSFDWGSSHPFSVGWWAEANGEEVIVPYAGVNYVFCPPAGTLIQIAEWYGAKDTFSNVGLKMSAADIAKGIKEREIGMLATGWIKTQPVGGAADNQISDVRENDVDTIAIKMQKEGISWTRSDKSAGSRVIGLQLLRDRLAAALKKERPAIYFMQNCVGSIETLPNLPRDEIKIDDVDTSSIDHAYDMVRYRVLKGNNRLATNVDVKFTS